MISRKITTNSELQTQAFAQEFASQVKSKETVYLFGDLGAGKTTFTKGFAKGLGISERIISPTFTVIREHQTPQKLTLYHIDLYRLETMHQIKEIGLFDLVKEDNSVCVVEWAEKLGEALTTPRWEIHFTHGENDTRDIEVKKIE